MWFYFNNTKITVKIITHNNGNKDLRTAALFTAVSMVTVNVSPEKCLASFYICGLRRAKASTLYAMLFTAKDLEDLFCGSTAHFLEVYLICHVWFTNIHLIQGLSQSEKH